MLTKIASQDKADLETTLSDITARLDKDRESSDIALYALVKLAVARLTRLGETLKVSATKDYEALVRLNPELKEYPVEDFAIAYKYTPACTWWYPQAIAKLEAELKEKKKNAQEDKTAKKIDGYSDTTFSVRILEAT